MGEELPDDSGIVQRGDQPQPAPAMGHARTSITNARCINATQLQARGQDAMTSEQLQQWRTEGRRHLLIDVREPSEHAVNRIDGAILIPLRQLPSRLNEIPKGQPIVVHCKSGGRSAIAVAMLKLGGYEAHNLSGGIQAWERFQTEHSK